MEFSFISLFSGIGGMDLGLERAGMTCAAQIEIDPFCNLILEKHWPFVPKWNRIQNFRKSVWEKYCYEKRIDPYVHLIGGGFPCQDISTCGRGEGLEGARSGLWFEFFRIVRTLLPGWVLVENVSALRSRGADTVLSNLEGINYTCWAIVVGAECFQPHKRNRVWILAHSEREGLYQRRDLSSGSEPSKPLFTGSGISRRVASPKDSPGDWEQPRMVKLPLGGRVDGVSCKVVRLNNSHAIRAYGNAIVPDVVQSIGEAILAREQGLI